MKRLISEIEERILRLHHHDFGGYSLENTAAKMDMTVKEVKTHLKRIKRIAPQMFPILTQRQKAIITLYDQHMSRKAISEGLGVTLRQLCAEVQFLRRHGFLFNRKMAQYDPSMDERVKERF